MNRILSKMMKAEIAKIQSVFDKDIKDIVDVKQIKYLTKQKEKNIQMKKDYYTSLDNLKDKVTEVRINIEWKKSRVWGYNPHANVKIFTHSKDYGMKMYVYTGTASGCGYDKASSSVADCLNQNGNIIKMLCLAKKDKAIEASNKVLPYGSGYEIKPNFEGGVGMSCFENIFKYIGFKVNKVVSTDTFDAWICAKSKSKI